MKKCKVLNQSDQEEATILIVSLFSHKVGIILREPYISDVINEAYKIDFDDDLIITDLLNKASLVDVNLKCN